MVHRQATRHKQAQIQARSRRNGALVPREGEALDFPNTAAGSLQKIFTRSRAAQQVVEGGSTLAECKEAGLQESQHHSRQAGRQAGGRYRGERYPSLIPSASILCPAFIGVGGQKSSPHDLNIPSVHTFETEYPVTTPPVSSGWPREAEVGSCGFWLPRKDSRSKSEPT